MIKSSGVIRPIVHYPNPVLRKKAKAIRTITPEILRLIEDMFETMYDAPGVGLAAPQIGISVRLVVIDITQDRSQPLVFVNPKLTLPGKDRQSGEEGCLSIPGVVGQPVRLQRAKMEGLDRRGKRFEMEGEGLLARAFQHELDHLDGKLYIDRVTDKGTIRTLEKE